jgi:hypothetical protein
MSQFMAGLIVCFFAEDTGIFTGDDLKFDVGNQEPLVLQRPRNRKAFVLASRLR